MNSIRYTLFSESQGRKLLYTQPKGWDNDARSLKRSTDAWGIMYDHLEDVEFTRDGYEFIIQTERLEGFDAKILIIREERNRDDVWEIDYEGELDLTTKQQTKNGVKVSILQGGLSEELKSINSEKYELSRTTSVNGDDIGSLDYDKGVINGRDLLLTTQLQDDELKSLIGISNSPIFDTWYVPRLDKVFSGDSAVLAPISIPEKFNSQLNPNSFLPELNSTHPFVYRNQEIGVKNIRITIDCDVEFPQGGKNQLISVYKHRWNSDSDPFEYIEQFDLYRLDWNVGDPATPNFTINQTFDLSVDLGLNESLTFVFRLDAFFGSNTEWWEITQRNITIDMNQSSRKPSTSFTGLTIKKSYQRLSKIATGTDQLKTDYFTNGDFKDAIITNGKRIRNFEDSVELSLKQLNDSCRAMFNTSMGIERVNNVERFVIEPYEYFFNPSLLLELGRVTEVQETYNDKFLFGKIEAGYKKGGDYEEQQGLDEYNTQASFSHNFKKVDSDIDLQSDLRADTIGIELTRRKQKEDFPTEDTRYDKDNFIIDCYKNTGLGVLLYVNRPYHYDFANLPSGIFSPETAYNLRLTPKNNLYRISNSFAWLAPYRNKVTNFISGGRNTNLVTRLIGGIDRTENADIENSTLSNTILQPIQVTFKHRLTSEQFKILKGVDENGRPNWYKLISYIDDRGILNYGFILEYEPKDEGTMTLIKANLNTL